MAHRISIAFHAWLIFRQLQQQQQQQSDFLRVLTGNASSQLYLSGGAK